MPAAPTATSTVQPTATAKTACTKLQAMRDTLAAEQAQTFTGCRDARVATAIEAWQATARVPGTGHDAFFRLGAALKRAGLDEAEVRTTLYEQAAHARSAKKRRAEITGILKSLRRYGTLGGSGR